MDILKCRHRIRSPRDLNQTQQGSPVDYIECDLRKVLDQRTIGIYHGYFLDNVFGGPVNTVKWLYDRNILFTLGKLVGNLNPNIQIFGHIQDDRLYRQLLHLYADEYLEDFPDLVNQLIFYASDPGVAREAREISPESRISWNLHIHPAEPWCTRRNDFAFIPRNETGLRRAIASRVDNIVVSGINTEADFDDAIGFCETAQNYFTSLCLVTDYPNLVARLLSSL
jgi:hypothetical protein